MVRLLLLTSFLLPFGSSEASAAPSGFAALGLPAALGKARLRGLLQNFVTAGSGRRFRSLGDPKDFDHGHLLQDRAGAPVAILYHTQELAHEDSAGYLDADGRNWIQWLDGRIENARRYERSSYPASPEWDWFAASELPGLRAKHTILDRMLDPALLGAELGPSLQWTFAPTPCGAENDPASAVVSLTPSETPGTPPVCLALAR